MAQQKKLQGTVASVEYVKTTATGWSTYEIVFEDGTDIRAAFPPDASEPEPNQELSFYEGKYGWIVEKDQSGGNGGGGTATATAVKGGKTTTRKAPANKAESNGAAPSNTGGALNSGNDYWEAKFSYEVASRDPKIEFQTYFREVCALYGAALPNFETPPTSVEEVDKLMDEAFAKAKAIYANVQKQKFVTK